MRSSCAYLSLPSLDDGSIDWDKVAEDYHRRVMSPLAPEMMGRNLLVMHLKSMPREALAGVRLADVGCGPGNLLPSVGPLVKEFVGIDRSARALQIAQSVADHHGVRFTPVHGDVRTLELGPRFDIVVSINSVLPEDRVQVVEIFSAMSRMLTPAGKLLMILPSFDTTLYLKDLWVELYRRCTGSEREARSIETAFVRAKQLDHEICGYADDGVHQQCYHTLETIERELPMAGLRLTCAPRKVYYPWEMARQFDYGFFPSAEEIWDWFVIAELDR